jgi:hypothetical protein
VATILARRERSEASRPEVAGGASGSARGARDGAWVLVAALAGFTVFEGFVLFSVFAALPAFSGFADLRGFSDFLDFTFDFIWLRLVFFPDLPGAGGKFRLVG